MRQVWQIWLVLVSIYCVYKIHSKPECRWTGPEVAILGDDQKERSLGRREWTIAIENDDTLVVPILYWSSVSLYFSHPFKLWIQFNRLTKMALTVDEVLEKIESMGLYQIRLIFILSYIEWFNITFQVMVPTFISAEPKWMCVPHVNNTACNFTGEFTALDKRRCDMPREAWTFTDDFTSVVTQVPKRGHLQPRLHSWPVNWAHNCKMVYLLNVQHQKMNCGKAHLQSG